MDESLLCPTLRHDECSFCCLLRTLFGASNVLYFVQHSWRKTSVAETQIEMPHTPVMSTTGKFDFAISYIYTCVVLTHFFTGANLCQH